MGEKALRKILGKRAEQRAEAAEPPVGAQLDLIDAHFQRIARLGAGDRHGAGQNMPAHTRQVGRVDGGKRGRNSTSEVYIRNMLDAWVGYMGGAGTKIERPQLESIPA